MIRLLSGAALLAVAACSSVPSEAGGREQVQAAQTRHPVSGLRVVPLTVSAAGRTHRLQVEVAGTPAEQAKGLMFRTEMGANEGMIFPFNPAKKASFWMKNTVIPLDLVFIDGAGRVESVAARAVPYSLEPINSRGDVAAVLEINGGRAAELGIAPGAQVRW